MLKLLITSFKNKQKHYWKCTLENYIILLTNVTPISLIKNILLKTESRDTNRLHLCIIANELFPRNSNHIVIDCNAVKQIPYQKCVVYITNS